MHIDEWIAERARREELYRDACRQGAAISEAYQAGQADSTELFQAIRACDHAYLAWCETDRWPIEYEGVSDAA